MGPLKLEFSMVMSHCVFWELNKGPLQEMCMLLAAKSPLQPTLCPGETESCDLLKLSTSHFNCQEVISQVYPLKVPKILS